MYMHNFIDKVEWKETEKKDYVLYFGRFSEEKGIGTLIKVCKELPDVQLEFFLYPNKFIRTVKWMPKKMFSFKAAVPLIKYSWKVMMTDLLGTLCNNLGSFIIGAKYNSADLAYYTKL